MLPPSEGEPVGQDASPERQPSIAPAMRASDQERDATMQRLQTAFAEGRLNDEEFDARRRAALTARTRTALERLLADLPAASAHSTASGRTVSVQRQSSLLMAVLGGIERRGRWRVPERCTAVAVMGGCVLDLRAAQLSTPVTTITAVAIMGGVEVIVPPGVHVEMSGLPLMGGFSNRVREVDLPPDAPQVHIHGLALMGGVEVRTRQRQRKGETDA
jgi:hypothetical protein